MILISRSEHPPTHARALPDLRQRLMLTILVAAVGLAGCRAGPEVGAFVTIVNRSMSNISVSAVKDGQPYSVFPTPFEGCSQGRWGLEYGSYLIEVKSGSEATSVQIDSHTAASPPAQTIVIDRAGKIETDAPTWPSTEAPC